jgi:hypothetical protein
MRPDDRGVALAKMCCPSCGEYVELGESGVTFKHIFRASGGSFMFHDEQLVHECDVEAMRAFEAEHESAPAFSCDAWAAI